MFTRQAFKEKQIEGGNPGLVVIRGDSCSKGRGFEIQHYILDGHFLHIFVVKNVMMFFEKKKINNKRGRFFKRSKSALITQESMSHFLE